MFKIPLFVCASILQCLTFVYKISMRKKETPRCLPEGYNARGLLPSVVGLKSKTNPQIL